MAGKKRIRKKGTIDPIYQRYAAGLEKALYSEEFYNYFMSNLHSGTRSIQFSNRKLEKKIDASWIIAIENCLDAFNNIIKNPRNFIIEEEEVVNVAVARQSTPDVLKHLTTHGQYIDEMNDDGVRPNHLLNKFKEDSWNTYENRFVYTLLEKTTEFVSKRYDAIFSGMEGEFGAFLKVEAESRNDADTVSTKFDVRIRESEDNLADDDNSVDLFRRLKRINDELKNLNQSKFAAILKKFARVKNPIVKTNAIQKNPNYKACYKLWIFIYAYKDVGYDINIYEQSTVIRPEFELDINNVVFANYLILKNYLDDASSRMIVTTEPYKKRVLKPKFIKKIIEQLVQNYDITDVEIRKVLIEEFTKAQLEQLEENERRKVVEEQERLKAEKRKRDALQKKRQQEQEQRARAQRLKRQEVEAAKAKEEKEKRREMIAEFMTVIAEELEKFRQGKEERLEKRAAEKKKYGRGIEAVTPEESAALEAAEEETREEPAEETVDEIGADVTAAGGTPAHKIPAERLPLSAVVAEETPAAQGNPEGSTSQEENTSDSSVRNETEEDLSAGKCAPAGELPAGYTSEETTGKPGPDEPVESVGKPGSDEPVESVGKPGPDEFAADYFDDGEEDDDGWTPVIDIFSEKTDESDLSWAEVAEMMGRNAEPEEETSDKLKESEEFKESEEELKKPEESEEPLEDLKEPEEFKEPEEELKEPGESEDLEEDLKGPEEFKEPEEELRKAEDTENPEEESEGMGAEPEESQSGSLKTEKMQEASEEKPHGLQKAVRDLFRRMRGDQ